MMSLGKPAVFLALTLALVIGLRANDAASSTNPYSPAVQRNIFGLIPIPPPAQPAPVPATPPLKITPNGITDILGQLEVLFKVDGKIPGKEDSYILTAGQSRDDIEVVRIDEKAGVVTFNNHGLMQSIPLLNSSAISAAAGIPAVSPFARGRIPGEMRLASRLVNSTPAVADAPAVIDTSTYLPAIPRRAVPMTPEEQAILNALQSQNIK